MGGVDVDIDKWMSDTRMQTSRSIQPLPAGSEPILSCFFFYKKKIVCVCVSLQVSLIVVQDHFFILQHNVFVNCFILRLFISLLVRPLLTLIYNYAFLHNLVVLREK